MVEMTQDDKAPAKEEGSGTPSVIQIEEEKKGDPRDQGAATASQAHELLAQTIVDVDADRE